MSKTIALAHIARHKKGSEISEPFQNLSQSLVLELCCQELTVQAGIAPFTRGWGDVNYNCAWRILPATKKGSEISEPFSNLISTVSP